MSNTGTLVYVVDDDASSREGVAGLLRSAGLMAKTFASGEEFLAARRPKVPSCLVLDVNLPGVRGLDLQRELAKSDVRVPIIFLTGHGDIPMTVSAIQAGAANFLTKPFDDEELLNAVRQCITSYREDEIRSGQKPENIISTSDNLEYQRLYLESETASEFDFQDIVGNSSTIKRVLEWVSIVAPTDSTVLLHGETGTGKELIARAVHNLSARRNRLFVRMNCAAIPSGLLESELFGHEKGAFTGALMEKRGRFEIAEHGSLFLDEIGDISLELQPKLLRALQEQEFERLGSTKTIHVNVRIIAATHQDLAAMISEGKFREDLFYRLNVFPIEIPPLRDRREDIPLLVHYFVLRHSRQMQKHVRSVPKYAMEALMNADWPGNIRQLENFIERCVIFTQGEELNVPHAELRSSAASAGSTFEQAARQVIINALKSSSGRIAGQGGAAERLGLRRTTLPNKMRKLNISRDYPA